MSAGRGGVVTSVALIRRATFSSFRSINFFTMLLFAQVYGFFWHVNKSLFCEKYVCGFDINGPNRWNFIYQWTLCGFTHEHPGTRRCTIHPCTLTPTLTKKHHKSLNFRTHLEHFRKSLCLPSRISGCALLNFCWSTKERVVTALGRRWTWRLWRAPTNTTAEVPQDAPLAIGRWSSVRLSSWVRSEKCSRICLRKGCQIASRCCRLAEEMLASLAFGSGRRISSTSLTSATRKSSELTQRLQVAVFTHCIVENRSDVTTRPSLFRDTPCKKGWSRCYVGPFLSHFSRHIFSRSGLPLHGQCSPRCCVVRSLTRFVRTTAFCGGWSAIEGASALQSCPLSAHSNRCVIAFHG